MGKEGERDKKREGEDEEGVSERGGRERGWGQRERYRERKKQRENVLYVRVSRI